MSGNLQTLRARTMGDTAISIPRNNTPAGKAPKRTASKAKRNLEDTAQTTEEEHRIGEIVKDNIGLVIYTATYLKIPMWHWDDCISDGMLTLWRCAKHFKPELGFKFSTYVSKALRQTMYNVMKGILPKHRQYFQLDETDYTSYLEEITEPYDYDISTIPFNILTKRDKAIIYMYYFENKNMVEIGKELGLTNERVRQIKFMALKKLREEMDAL